MLLLLLKPEKLNVNVSLITLSVVLNAAVGKIPSANNDTDTCQNLCQRESKETFTHLSIFFYNVLMQKPYYLVLFQGHKLAWCVFD